METGRLGLPRQSRLLIVVALVDSSGTGLFLTGSAVFFTRSAGLTTAEVGIGLTVAGLCALLTLTPLGMLADRIGPKPAAVVMHFWRAAGFVGYAFVHDFWAFLAIACFVGIPSRAIEPIGQMFADRHVGPDYRMRMMAVFRAVYNIGFTLGALLTTLILAVDTRAAFQSIVLGDALTFVIAGFLLIRVPLLHEGTKKRTVRGWPRSLRQGRYLLVAALNGIMVLHIPMLSVAIPLWATLHTNAPRVLVGPLIMINTLLAILLQVRVSKGIESLDGGIRAMRLGAVCLAACAVVLAFAGRLDAVGASVLLVAGIVLLSFGEIYQSAGGWSLSYELAPRERQGEYLAVFSLGMAAMYTVGPALVTIGVVEQGLPGWLVLAAVFLAAGWVVRPVALAAKAQVHADTVATHR
ncbi:MAG TPA: MFS transporter [Actinophytocola sp.]|jgi:MFS family permease|uniref:MFS transporter n=1 Tax=Actinophytocola sp. TaxID=1872138 RepID=UPI002DF8598E|nr:MFS transporter [Actinophytocola sp.]